MASSILISTIFLVIVVTVQVSGRAINEADVLESGREYIGWPPYNLRTMRIIYPPLDQRIGIYPRRTTEGIRNLARELPLTTTGFGLGAGATGRQYELNSGYPFYPSGNYPYSGLGGANYYPYYYGSVVGYQPYYQQPPQYVV